MTNFIGSKTTRCFLLLCTITLIGVSSVHAHPGHGDVDESGDVVRHYVTEPEHIASIAAVLAASIYFAVAMRRRKSFHCEHESTNDLSSRI